MPLDINDFRDDSKDGTLAKIRASEAARFGDAKLVDEIVALDQQWRQGVHTKDNMRKEMGLISKSIGQKKKAGATKEEIKEIADKVKGMKVDLKAHETKLDTLTQTIKKKVAAIGNYVHETVPVGEDEEECNRVERTWGEFKQTGEELHHHQLLYMIGGYEPDRGSSVAGHRGYFLTGVGVLLNQAIINYGLAFLGSRKYTPVQAPFFMKKEVMAETAQLSQFDEELYKVVGNEGDEKYLIATSEQPISAFHRKEWINVDEVPLRYAGISTCFRKEAGSSGKDCWGIFRVHQFEKVEQFCITSPEESWAEHEQMIRYSEEFYKSLEIPYRVVAICSGALNNAAAKKYDLEAWFPTLGCFRELVSCSNCTDYQSRAMEIRYGQKKNNREKKYVHMLNSTLCATERAICCLLENYQCAEGVRVPEVLQPFMGGMKLMPFVREKPKNINQIKSKRAKDRKEKAKKAEAAAKKAAAKA